MILIANPFYTIFNEQNWYYDSINKKFFFSNELATTNNLILDIPLKNDIQYNIKILNLLNIFFEKIIKKIYNPKNKIIKYNIDKKFIHFKNNTVLYLKEIKINNINIELNIGFLNHP